MNVSHIKFIGNEQFTEVRGYDTVDVSNPGKILFIWTKKEEVLIYNFDLIEYISSTVEEA